MATPDYLRLEHLNSLVGAQTVSQLLDDDDDGLTEGTHTNEILTAAEAEAASYMLNSFTDDQVTKLGRNDAAFRAHVAWVALEFASERRTEFTAMDGKGRFWAQYERAVAFFVNAAKSKLRLKGEKQAGPNANEGGSRNPPVAPPNPKFIFAPDKDNPTGAGGF